MTYELTIPAAGESIVEVQILQWLKQEGQWFRKDETLVQIETAKATLDLPAPFAGVLTRILKHDGETAQVAEVIGYLEEATTPPRAGPAEEQAAEIPSSDAAAPVAVAQPQAPTPPVTTRRDSETLPDRQQGETPTEPSAGSTNLSPARLESRTASRAPVTLASYSPSASAARQEETVPMSPIRREIASRLLRAQQTAAMLTTFNELEMSAVIELRRTFREPFQEQYGVKLGFMSFFVKAVVEALKLHPPLNAEIRGRDIVYRHYYDIGVAVGGGKGLVVPVLRSAEGMSFVAIERALADFAVRAGENKLKVEELDGGTFTISNGGVYGSLLSTPILNPPQSGILGMHAIQERPVARDGHVVIRPMMYVALTYDHRLVDGREAVGFLRRVKEVIEEPTRLLLEI